MSLIIKSGNRRYVPYGAATFEWRLVPGRRRTIPIRDEDAAIAQTGNPWLGAARRRKVKPKPQLMSTVWPTLALGTMYVGGKPIGLYVVKPLDQKIERLERYTLALGYCGPFCLGPVAEARILAGEMRADDAFWMTGSPENILESIERELKGKPSRELGYLSRLITAKQVPVRLSW